MEERVNLIGITDLLNRDTVKPDIDLKAFEDEFIMLDPHGGGGGGGGSGGTQLNPPTEKENIEFRQYFDQILDDEHDDQASVHSVESVHSRGSLESRGSHRSHRSRGLEPASAERKRYIEHSDPVEAYLRKETTEDYEELYDVVVELYSELKSFGADLSGMPDPNKGIRFSMDELRKLKNILERRYNKYRTAQLGTDAILSLAQVLGYVFDGKQKLGPITPNFSNLDNSLRPRIKRMQYQISQATDRLLNSMGVTNDSRIFLELGLATLAHSKLQSEKSDLTAANNSKVAEALQDLTTI